MSNTFYNGNKLLSFKDLDRKAPELFFCCGNRTAGKTFYFKRWFVRRFISAGELFTVFVRYIDDIPSVSEGFWADVGPIAFPGRSMSQRPLLHGKAAEMLLDGVRCGYVIALNDPERIKRNSALFADAARGFLDEFQSEAGKYVPKEVEKFNSIRLSIARGGAKGTHARYFPVYLCSNAVTIFNPYFEAFHVSDRLNESVRFLRGSGWVLEQIYNADAAAAIQGAFSTLSGKELDYATKNKFLLDDGRFIDEEGGRKQYAATIRRGDRSFGIWQAGEMLYVSRKIDPDFGSILVFAEEDHSPGTYLVQRGDPIYKMLRRQYDIGAVRFADGASRNAFVSCLAYIK